MSESARVVPMFLIDPGQAAKDGDFTFELEPRINAGRTVRFALNSRDAEMLHKALGDFLRNVK